MIEKKTVEEELKKILEGTEIFLVGIQVDRNNRILVHMDKNDGISVDECARISRELEARLDRDREDFALEVSSPGLDAPFRVAQQYRKNMGKMVKVECHDGNRYLGVLRDIRDDSILLELRTGKREVETKELAFRDIRSTKAHIQF